MNKPKCPFCGSTKWTKPKWAAKNQQRQCKECNSLYYKDKFKRTIS